LIVVDREKKKLRKLLGNSPSRGPYFLVRIDDFHLKQCIFEGKGPKNVKKGVSFSRINFRLHQI